MHKKKKNSENCNIWVRWAFGEEFIWPVQAAAEGLERQLLTVAISVVSVVQVVPAHFPASTLGKDVVLL